MFVLNIWGAGFLYFFMQHILLYVMMFSVLIQNVPVTKFRVEKEE